ncbi:DUF3160 domain-containing protein [Candidatus Dojkabacteria bacterium]|nr:DUF3160 domain-containing protein [Candidatus Dojkabacteria bacterium]
MKENNKKIIATVLVVTVSLLCFGVLIGLGITYFLKEGKDQIAKSDDKSSKSAEETETIKITQRKPFATVKIDEEIYSPKVPEYNTGEDLVNVVNLDRFGFQESELDKLETNYFIVADDQKSNSQHEEFFPIYEENRYSDIPNFITTDSALHTYHLMFNDTLKTLEQAVFYDKMKDVTNSMFEESKNQYEYFKKVGNKELEPAALRNVAYFAVAMELYEEDVQIPEYVKEYVDEEIKLIEKHEKIALSPVLNLNTDPSLEEFVEDIKEDYTQYIPRGHYTKTELLKKYFKVMMWYGRATFLQSDESQSKSAMLMTHALLKNNEAFNSWADVYDATSFFVGNSDDLGVYEYSDVMKIVFGDNPELKDFDNYENLEKFMEQIKELEAPQINSVPIFDESLNKDREEKIKGFRFMGQRYTLDADIFQRLVYREVKENEEQQQRMLPKSLDILAAMGSEKAYELLVSQGDTKFEGYDKNLQTLKSKITKFEEDTWTQNLYWGWLYTLRPFTEEFEKNYPAFMTNKAWAYKDLNSYQGSWTELKHDTILYAKQVYAEMGAGGGAVPIELDDRGYVEPRVEVYARLEALADATIKGLDERRMFNINFEYSENSDCPEDVNEEDKPFMCPLMEYKFEGKTLKDNLIRLRDLSSKLKDISIKELENKKLTEDDYTFIREYGGEIEHMWYSTFHTDADIHTTLNKNPLMLVADVATDPNGLVLEEATGEVMEIFVIIPVSGGKEDYYRVARGTVWSQYEFTQPMDQRLTDEKWQEMVRNEEIPELADWKKQYIIQTDTIRVKAVPQSYKEAIDNEWMTPDEAKRDCADSAGTFVECGNVCPEYDQDCDKECEPICKYY